MRGSRTWALAASDADMGRLEALMAAPLSAASAPLALAGLCGNLELYDAILRARRIDPAADVRPLVAMTLDLWANWSLGAGPDGAWPEGMRERARTLAASCPSPDLRGLLGPLVLRLDQADGQAAEYGGYDYDNNSDAFRTVPGHAGGTYVTICDDDGRVFRTEAISPDVVEAPEGLRERIASALFPDIGRTPR